MTKQPEALRLAEHLEHPSVPVNVEKEAAKELRRLHSLNQELLEALGQIIALDRTEENEWDAVERVIPIMVEIARAAIAKAGEQA
jgi:hypothetical protein